MPKIRLNIWFGADLCQDLTDTRLQIVFRLFGKSVLFSVSIGELFPLAHSFHRVLSSSTKTYGICPCFQSEIQTVNREKENCKLDCKLAQGKKTMKLEVLKVSPQSSYKTLSTDISLCQHCNHPSRPHTNTNITHCPLLYLNSCSIYKRWHKIQHLFKICSVKLFMFLMHCIWNAFIFVSLVFAIIWRRYWCHCTHFMGQSQRASGTYMKLCT